MQHEEHGMEHGMEHGASMSSASMSHMGHMDDLKRRFIISLLLTLPVLLLSPMMGLSLPFQFTFPGSDWVVLALCTVLFFYGGKPFLTGALGELKAQRPAMMTLIAMGVLAAYLYSLYAFIINHTQADAHVMDFFWELATLIVIMLLGHWIEMKAVAGAGDALESMARLLPSQANVRQADGQFVQVPLQSLQVGQFVMVAADEKIPADGTIREGSTTVNESMVTGEARAVPKTVGDRVIGGAQNGSGSVLMEVTGTGESGYLAQVMQLVGSAQQSKSRVETISDRVARWLFYIAAFAGIAAFVVWYLITGALDTALERMVTVLVIACPHALGLAIPLVTARSTTLGARNGLLLRNRLALERARQVNVVTMDKTGTLTEGNFRVTEVLPLAADITQDAVLATMAGLEAGSTHPLAAGIRGEAQTRGVRPVAALEVHNEPGIGPAGKLPDGRAAQIAPASYLDRQGITYDRDRYGVLSGQGSSVSFLVIDGKAVGLIAQGDTIKPQAKTLLEGLAKQSIEPVMLTGDNEAAAQKTAELLGIASYRAGLLPGDKEQVIAEYQQAGKVVMMVGDGVNDAPSLARADIGVAIGAGTDVAIDAADVVLVKSDPADILHFLSLAKNTARKMRQNLWWGAGYNIIAIPLAAGVLAPIGILLSPAVGAILMSLSTVIVAVNALTLRIE